MNRYSVKEDIQEVKRWAEMSMKEAIAEMGKQASNQDNSMKVGLFTISTKDDISQTNIFEDEDEEDGQMGSIQKSLSEYLSTVDAKTVMGEAEDAKTVMGEAEDANTNISKLCEDLRNRFQAEDLEILIVVDQDELDAIEREEGVTSEEEGVRNLQIIADLTESCDCCNFATLEDLNALACYRQRLEAKIDLCKCYEAIETEPHKCRLEMKSLGFKNVVALISPSCLFSFKSKSNSECSGETAKPNWLSDDFNYRKNSEAWNYLRFVYNIEKLVGIKIVDISDIKGLQSARLIERNKLNESFRYE